MKTKCTKIHDVSLKLVLDLRLRSHERGPVRGVASTALVDRDGWSVLNISNVALEHDVGPVLRHLVVEGLEISDSIVRLLQVAFKLPDLSRYLWVLTLHCLQSGDVSGRSCSDNAVIRNGLRDVIEAALKAAHAANSNEVLGCAAPVLVPSGCVLAQDVTVRNPVNLVAGVTVLVPVLVELQSKGALGILRFHFFGSKGDAEKGSEEVPDVVGSIGVSDVAQKGGTC